MSKGFRETPRRYDGPLSGHIGPGPRPGPKKAVNVSVDAALVALARELGLNLSQVLEQELRRRTEEERRRRAQEEMRPFVESYNALIERAGVFGEEWLDLDDDPAV